jgi:hypothetical protein
MEEFGAVAVVGLGVDQENEGVFAMCAEGLEG